MSSNYYKKSKDDINTGYEYYREGENKNEEELSRIFILVSTIIIPLLTSVFFGNEIFEKIKIVPKLFLLSGWFFQIISLILGLCQFIANYGFFKSSRKILEELLLKIDSMTDKDSKIIYKTKSENLNKLPKHSNIWPLRFQIGFLFFGLLLFWISIIILFFF